MYMIAIYLIIIFGAMTHLYFDKQPRTTERVLEVVLLYLLFIGGFGGLVGFVARVVYVEQIIQYSNWPLGSPFLFDLGLANLALGLLGILCIWLRGNFWVLTVVVGAIFSWAAARGYYMQSPVFGGFVTGSLDWRIYADILAPFVNIGLLLAYKVVQAKNRHVVGILAVNRHYPG